MDGDRHGPQRRSGQHHHRDDGPARPLGCAVAEVFGMPGKCEARVVEQFLGDRRGDQGGRTLVEDVVHGTVDRLDDPGRIFASRLSRPVRGNGARAARRAGRVERRRRRRWGPLDDRWIEPDQPGARGNQGRVADHVEGRAIALSSRLPGLDRDVGSNARRVADGQRERRDDAWRHAALNAR